MKCILACIRKDFRLFFSNVPGAVLSLLLPLLVCVLLFSGGRELMQSAASVKPFAIAVRDEDNTFMSRTLVEQLASIELFSEVIEADLQTDEALFSGNVAAVITIPKNFFYLAYDMQSEIGLALNEAMPTESTIVKQLTVTALELITNNQIAALAKSELTGAGEAPDEAKAEAARSIFRDAFTMLDMMQSGTALLTAVDTVTAMLMACVLSLFCMLIPLQVASTLVDDRTLGILPRYTAAGGTVLALTLSKFLSALVLTGVPVSVVCLSVIPNRAAAVLSVAGVLFLSSFGVSLLFAALSHRTERFLLWGNLYILASLLFSGVIYPLSVMPDALSGLRYMMLPFYALSGVHSALYGWENGYATLLPALLTGMFCLLSSTLLICRKRRRV